MSVGMPGYNATASDIAAASATSPATPGDSIVEVTSTAQITSTGPQMMMTAAGDATLPEQVAYVPMAKPGTGFPVTIPAGAESIVGQTPQTLQQPAQTAAATDDAAQKIAAADAGVTAPKPTAAAPATPATNEVYVTAAAPQQVDAPKKGFFASLFSTAPASAAPAPLINSRSGEQPAVAAQSKEAPAKPIVTLASATSADKPVQLASLGDDSSSHITGADALPGVRQTALFEIKRKSGIDDESDVDLNEDEGSGGSYQVASAAGLARLAPNGLLKQNESVDVACLKPSLVRVLKTIEGHYGRKMMVTSGYRDPARNRRANGAKNSLHMYCAAADIQVPGVSKWELASYIRTMPGRGGVGTYCHTESVHVDVGPERDWNWRCRRRG
ncbi:YcbK family protein [Mesorhizobium caraganae]|uniref:YcbK family protein n=1 Tax=Mesorhizobium caraganae TaxID=483206 RepID=A0ABV1YXE5_9HYPH